MKLRIYDVEHNDRTYFDVYSVAENGNETYLKCFVYNEKEELKEIWGKDIAYSKAKEFVANFENKEVKNLIYETGSGDKDGCVNHETE